VAEAGISNAVSALAFARENTPEAFSIKTFAALSVAATFVCSHRVVVVVGRNAGRWTDVVAPTNSFNSVPRPFSVAGRRVYFVFLKFFFITLVPRKYSRFRRTNRDFFRYLWTCFFPRSLGRRVLFYLLFFFPTDLLLLISSTPETLKVNSKRFMHRRRRQLLLYLGPSPRRRRRITIAR